MGNASVNLAQLSQAAQQAEAAGKAMQAQANGQPAPAGGVQAIPADTLKAMLPQSLPAGFARTEVSASSTGAAGPISGSNASGTFTPAGDRACRRSRSATWPAVGALAAVLGGRVSTSQSDRETADRL